MLPATQDSFFAELGLIRIQYVAPFSKGQGNTCLRVSSPMP